ncbi:MAG: hypothetical protein HY673_12975 [Chloroflexi bacterium]|nr:hypothetical protein [Chloroflexota bacterium]
MTEEAISNILERLTALEQSVLKNCEAIAATTEAIQGLKTAISLTQRSNPTTVLLVKWVIAPMLVIVGGVVGIKLVFPGLGG